MSDTSVGNPPGASSPEGVPPGSPEGGPPGSAGGPAGESGRSGAGRHRYAQAHRRRWPRVLAWTAGTLAVLLALGAVGAYGLYQHLQGNITIKDIRSALGPESSRPKVVATRAPQAKYSAENILLLGSDTRQGVGNSGYGSSSVYTTAHSDTVILLHLAADRRSAVAVSIPRDSWVQLPPCVLPDGSMSREHVDRFNAAFTLGGAACTIKAVEQLTQVRIDHYAVIDFGGFKNMVNALGGVEVCVNKAVHDPKSKLDLPAGRSVVNGTTALAYVRARYTLGDGSDLGRIDRQQQFLMSVINKAESGNLLYNPYHLVQFLDAATKSLTTDPGLGSLTALRRLATSVRSIPRSHILFLTVPNQPYPPNPNVVEWDAASANAIFTALREDRPLPGTPGAAASASPSPAPSATASPLHTAPSGVRVLVLNGSGVAGAASRTAQALRGLGFDVAGVGSADRSDYATTTVRRDPAYDESGRTVLAAVPGAAEQVVPGLGRTLVVVVGRDSLPVAASLPPVAASTSSAPSSPTAVATPAFRTADANICS